MKKIRRQAGLVFIGVKHESQDARRFIRRFTVISRRRLSIVKFLADPSDGVVTHRLSQPGGSS
jgi:hypothetical protein